MNARKQLVVIDLSGVSTEAELHTLLAATLQFPEFYGRNWDAFWDAICGLVDMPFTLQLTGWHQFAVRMPHEAKSLRCCLEQHRGGHPEAASDVHYS